VSPRERAAAAHAAAELAPHPRDKAAWKAAAAAWERIAGPGTPWSTKLLTSDLADLKRDIAHARGPFQPPQPPKAPSPQAVKPENVAALAQAFKERLTPTMDPVTIEF
jgi:hypothetical protein